VTDAVKSGRLTDAVQNLLDWLAKAEIYLAEDQPILGDLDTVNILIEKHKVTSLLAELYNGLGSVTVRTLDMRSRSLVQLPVGSLSSG